METRSITSTELAAFIRYLGTVERSVGTIEKYFRDTGRFAASLRVFFRGGGKSLRAPLRFPSGAVF